MMARVVYVCLVFFNFAPQVCGQPHEKDVVCGPRCVQYVLETLGVPENLIDLVEEIQGSDIGGGASIRDLQIAIEKRGLCTKAIAVSHAWLVPDWPYLAIAHCRTPLGDGHFVVRLPEAAYSGAGYWDGLRGVHQKMPDEYVLTGHYLVVSKNEIRLGSRHVFLGLLVGGVVLACLVVCFEFVLGQPGSYWLSTEARENGRQPSKL